MISVNGESQTFLAETVDELLRRLSIEPKGVAVAVDGEIVRKSEWAATKIEDGSSIEIVTAAAGG